jgi:hypothetical protein
MKDEVEREEKEESREFSGMLGSCWEVRVWSSILLDSADNRFITFLLAN